MLALFKQNKYLFIVAGLVVALFVWYSMSGGATEEPVLASENVTGTNTESERELVNNLLELRSIKLEGQIFSDPAFARLRDFSTAIVSEPIGRRNPFAPLGAPVETTTTEVVQ